MKQLEAVPGQPGSATHAKPALKDSFAPGDAPVNRDVSGLVKGQRDIAAAEIADRMAAKKAQRVGMQLEQWKKAFDEMDKAAMKAPLSAQVRAGVVARGAARS